MTHILAFLIGGLISWYATQQYYITKSNNIKLGNWTLLCWKSFNDKEKSYVAYLRHNELKRYIHVELKSNEEFEVLINGSSEKR